MQKCKIDWKRFFLLLPIVILVYGCDRNSSYQDFVDNPEKIQQIYLGCLEDQKHTSKFCQDIIQKYSDMPILFKEALLTPQQFGMKVLNLQIDITKLKETQLSSSSVQLLNDIRNKEKLLNKYYFILSTIFNVK